MIFKQGEIVIIPFPFTDLSSIKQRPVLILSKENYNNKTEDIIICGITSNPKAIEFSVIIDNNNLKEGQIPIKSKVKVDKIFTLNQQLVIKKVATLDKETLNQVLTKLNYLF